MKNAALFFLVLASFAVGCNSDHMATPSTDGSSGGGGGGAGGALTYLGRIQPIFKARCSACHNSTSAIPNWLDYATAFSLKSMIYQKAVVDQSMPPGNITGITAAERTEIGAWINAGAPEGDGTGGGGGNGGGGGGGGGTGEGPTPTPSNTAPPDFTPIRYVKEACLGCHVNEGNPTVPFFARIAGQQSTYMEKELQSFHDQTRTSPEAKAFMWAPTEKLSESEIQLLALYFSMQTPIPNAPGDPAQAAVGQVLFTQGIPGKNVTACASCHGTDAHGTALAPRLAGQNIEYIENQFDAFREGQRGDATVMPAYAKQMTDDQVDALANYLQGLQ